MYAELSLTAASFVLVLTIMTQKVNFISEQVKVPRSEGKEIRFRSDSETPIQKKFLSNHVSTITNHHFPGHYEWIPTKISEVSQYEEVAVEGGIEGWDLSPLYVIRAWHDGDLIPGRVSIKYKKASVSYSGKEHTKEQFEILCSTPGLLKWAPSSYGKVPPGAIPGGRTSKGEPQYIGKARFKESMVPGRVHPSQRCCYIGYYGDETWQYEYEVLCRIL